MVLCQAFLSLLPPPPSSIKNVPSPIPLGRPVAQARSNVINQVQFYPDLSLEISVDLPALRSNVINQVPFYPDLSLEISIDLPEC